MIWNRLPHLINYRHSGCVFVNPLIRVVLGVNPMSVNATSLESEAIQLSQRDREREVVAEFCRSFGRTLIDRYGDGAVARPARPTDPIRRQVPPADHRTPARPGFPADAATNEPSAGLSTPARSVSVPALPSESSNASTTASPPARQAGELGPMSPRLTQTLELLLEGLSEKQVAARLQISRHTAHDYVKRLYKIAAVSSRAELLAKVLRQRSA